MRERIQPLLGVRFDLPKAPGTCPDAVMMFEQCLEDEISADLCAQLERHLAACDRCRGACDTLSRTLALCRASAETTAVPALVQASVRAALREWLAERA